MTIPPLGTRLRRALNKADLTAIRHALEAGASPDTPHPLTQDETRRRGTRVSTSFGVALIRQQWDVASLLLAFGADPWAKPSEPGPGGSWSATTSAWEAITVDGSDGEDDEAIRWLATRRPQDVLPVARPDSRPCLWELLAKRACPAALLREVSDYDPEKNGLPPAGVVMSVTSIALAKGAFSDVEAWFQVVERLHEHLVPGPPDWLAIAKQARVEGNRHACRCAIEKMGLPLWSSTEPDDAGWRLAGSMAHRGWAEDLVPAVRGARPDEAWCLLIASASANSEGFSALLDANPAVVARLVRDPSPVLEVLLDSDASLKRLPDFLRILIERGCSLHEVKVKGLSPLQAFARQLESRSPTGQVPAVRLCETIANALSRAAAPFTDAEASALRVFLPKWVGAREERALKKSLPSSASSPRRARL